MRNHLSTYDAVDVEAPHARLERYGRDSNVHQAIITSLERMKHERSNDCGGICFNLTDALVRDHNIFCINGYDVLEVAVGDGPIHGYVGSRETWTGDFLEARLQLIDDLLEALRCPTLSC